MYNAKLVKDRISNLLKNKSCTQKQLLLDCDINPNALNQMTDKKGIGCFALARIADYLETSTDFLAGYYKTA